MVYSVEHTRKNGGRITRSKEYQSAEMALKMGLMILETADPGDTVVVIWSGHKAAGVLHSWVK